MEIRNLSEQNGPNGVVGKVAEGEAKLTAKLIRANGEVVDLGELKKPWHIRLRNQVQAALGLTVGVGILWLVSKYHLNWLLPASLLPVFGLVTDQGVADLAAQFVSGATGLATYTYHASGTGTNTPAVTDTALQTELTFALGAPASRPAASSQTSTGSSSVSPATMTSVGTIAYTASASITEWGLFNSATINAGHMWDHRTFAVISVINGDSIQFTYTLSIPSGGS